MTDQNAKATTLKQYLQVGIPTLNVKFDYTSATKERLPLLDETVLKLLSIHDQCSLDDIRSLLGLTTQEAKILYTDLLKKDLIQISTGLQNIEPVLEKGAKAPELFDYETKRNSIKRNFIALNGIIEETSLSRKNAELFFEIDSKAEQSKISDDQLRSYFVKHFDDLDDSGEEVFFHSINGIKSSLNNDSYVFPLQAEVDLCGEDRLSFTIPAEAKLDTFTEDLLSQSYQKLEWDSSLDRSSDETNPDFASWLDLGPDLREALLNETPRSLALSFCDQEMTIVPGVTLFIDLSTQSIGAENYFSTIKIAKKLQWNQLEYCSKHSFEVPKCYWKSAANLGNVHYQRISIGLDALAKDSDTGRETLDLSNIERTEVWDYVREHIQEDVFPAFFDGLTSERTDIFYLPGQCLLTTFHLLAGEVVCDYRREGIYVPLTLYITKPEILEIIQTLIDKYEVAEKSKFPMSKSVKPEKHHLSARAASSSSYEDSAMSPEVFEQTAANTIDSDFQITPEEVCHWILESYNAAEKDEHGRVSGEDIQELLSVQLPNFKWETVGARDIKKFLKKYRDRFDLVEGYKSIRVKPKPQQETQTEPAEGKNAFVYTSVKKAKQQNKGNFGSMGHELLNALEKKSKDN